MILQAIYGVAELLKTKLNTPVATLFLGVMLAWDLWAEDAASIYDYQAVTRQPGHFSNYRWRPTDSPHPRAENGAGAYRAGEELLPGRTQAIMTPGPDAYRPRDKNYGIAPQVGAYRFRTISPDERSRFDRPEPADSSVKSHRYISMPTFRDYGGHQLQRTPEAKQNFRFRPEERFSSRGGEHGSVYMANPATAVPPDYAAPVFRQGD